MVKISPDFTITSIGNGFILEDKRTLPSDKPFDRKAQIKSYSTLQEVMDVLKIAYVRPLPRGAGPG